MEFNSQKEKMVIKIDGVDYKISKPKMKDIIFMSEKQNEMASKSDTEKTMFLIDFMENFGLPKSVSLELEPDLFLQIVELVTGSSKKK